MTEAGTCSYESWKAARDAELRQPEGWLSLVGLHGLELGGNAIGCAEECPVRLPAGPDLLGNLLWQQGRVFWQGQDSGWQIENAAGIEETAGIPLHTDRDGSPSILRIGDMSLFIIEREGRLAVRVKDRGWAQRQPFAGLDYFPYNADWGLEARWEALTTPLALEVPTMTGDIKTVPVTHRAVFQVGEREYSLLPLEVDASGVFFVLRDATSGKTSYGGGRFLRAKLPVDGRMLLDFNRAYNPPCAFTPFAACPLPPPENRLPLAVEAGEKAWRGEH